MDQETTYVRSDTMEQNNSQQAVNNTSTNRGLFEWLKFVVFFAAIFLITVLVIRVIGPIIFTQYVPPIMGLTEESGEVVPIDAQDGDSEVVPIEAEDGDETDSTGSEAGETGDDAGAESEDSQQIDESETEPLQTDEETSGKVEGEETETAESEPATVIYIVQYGDTLTSIAAANQLTVEQLLAANDIVNPNLLKPGDELMIPQ